MISHISAACGIEYQLKKLSKLTIFTLKTGSDVQKPKSGLFSDWIGNNTDDLRCSD